MLYVKLLVVDGIVPAMNCSTGVTWVLRYLFANIFKLCNATSRDDSLVPRAFTPCKFSNNNNILWSLDKIPGTGCSKKFKYDLI